MDTKQLLELFNDRNLASKKTSSEFQEFLGLAQQLGADEEFQTNLKRRWKKLSGTTFMNDPVHGSRSAVIFDSRGDMGGGKSFKKTSPPSEGGASFWGSKPYSIEESLHDRMERVTAGKTYSEVKAKLENTMNANDLLLEKNDQLKANCAAWQREIELLKSNYQRLTDAIVEKERECFKLDAENKRLKIENQQLQRNVTALSDYVNKMGNN